MANFTKWARILESGKSSLKSFLLVPESGSRTIS